MFQNAGYRNYFKYKIRIKNQTEELATIKTNVYFVASLQFTHPIWGKHISCESKTRILIISPSPISSVGVYVMLLRYGVMFGASKRESFWKPPAGPQTNLCKAAHHFWLSHITLIGVGAWKLIFVGAAKSSSKALSAAARHYHIHVRISRVCLRAPTVAKWELYRREPNVKWTREGVYDAPLFGLYGEPKRIFD